MDVRLRSIRYLSTLTLLSVAAPVFADGNRSQPRLEDEIRWARSIWPEEFAEARFTLLLPKLLSWVRPGEETLAYLFADGYPCSGAVLSREARYPEDLEVHVIQSREMVDGRLVRKYKDVGVSRHGLLTEWCGGGSDVLRADGHWEHLSGWGCGDGGRDLGFLSHVESKVARFSGTLLRVETWCDGPTRWLPCASGGERPCLLCDDIGIGLVGYRDGFGRGRLPGRRAVTCDDPCPNVNSSQKLERIRALAERVTPWKVSPLTPAATPSLYRSYPECRKAHLNSREDLPEQTVDAFCRGYGSCCQAHGFAFNAAVCAANLRPPVAELIQCPPPQVYDPEAAADCRAQIQATLARCSPVSIEPASCRSMCRGVLPAGAPCQDARECAGVADANVACTNWGNEDTSRCLIQPRGKDGDVCTDTFVELPTGGTETRRIPVSKPMLDPQGAAMCHSRDGLYCGTDSRCHRMTPIGGSCEQDFHSGCQIDAFCDGKTCYPRATAGQSCAQAACALDSYCTAAKTCAVKKPAGEPCNLADECMSMYCTPNRTCFNNARRALEVTPASCAAPKLGAKATKPYRVSNVGHRQRTKDRPRTCREYYASAKRSPYLFNSDIGRLRGAHGS